MTTFDLDREVREAMEQKWNKVERTDEEKIQEILELFASLPLPERKKMFQRIKSELKKIGFDDIKYTGLPY